MNSPSPFKPKDNAVSRPFLARQVKLYSHNAQQVYKRVFNAFAYQVFQVHIILPIIANPEGARAIEKLVEEETAKVKADLAAEAKRVDHLMETNGVSETSEWTAGRDAVAHVTSPTAGEFLQMILTLDGIAKNVGALWILGVINADQYRQAGYRLQRMLIKFAGRQRMVCMRAMAAARRAKSGIVDETIEQEADDAMRRAEAVHEGGTGDFGEDGNAPLEAGVAAQIEQAVDGSGAAAGEDSATGEGGDTHKAKKPKGPKDPNVGKTTDPETGEVLAFSANASIPVRRRKAADKAAAE